MDHQEREGAMTQRTAGRQKFMGATQSVLLISEREDITQILTKCIAGYRVVHAATVDAALARGLDEGFDLVIAHIESVAAAALDGLEILRAYDADVSLVLFADRLPAAALAGAAAGLGVLDVLAEPPTTEVLQRLLKQATNERCAAALRASTGPRSYVGPLGVVLHPVVDPRRSYVVGHMARGGEDAAHARTQACAAFTDRTLSLFVDVEAEEIADGSLLKEPALVALAANVVLQVRLDDTSLRHGALPLRLASLRRAGFRLGFVDCAPRHYADLSELSPEYIVLDARLTRRMDASRGKSEIVQSIVERAHQLDALVIAVGISTAEERTALTGAQCDLIQGPLVNRRPVAARLAR